MNSYQQILPNILVKASAGSGKTTALTARIIKILLMGESPDRILATTFTKKAANEITERLINKLISIVNNPESVKQILNPAYIKKTPLQVLKDVFEHQHRLKICTLDSLFNQIASSFSYEIDLLPDWRVSENDEDSQIMKEALFLLFFREDKKLLSELTKQIKHGIGTKSVYKSLLKLLNDLYILYLQAEEQAWNWIEQPKQIEKHILDKSLKDLQEFEIPLTAQKTPNKNWVKAIEHSLSDFKKGNWSSFLGKGIAAKILDGSNVYRSSKVDSSLINIFSPLMSQAKALLIKSLREQLYAMHKLCSIYDVEYRKTRKLFHSLSFSDIKHRLSQAQFLGDLESIYYRLDCKFAHILLDEFQDTSQVEWQIIEPMVDELLSKADGERSFYCVGDIKQAIYGWRGGDANIFDLLQERYPQLSSESRETTYRCSEQVIETLNLVFRNLDKVQVLESFVPVLEKWQRSFLPHSTARDDIEGYCELIGVEKSESEQDIFKQAAEFVRKLSLEHPELVIGVLLRKNSSISRILEEFSEFEPPLRASGEGGNSLTDSSAVRVFLSAMILIDHPDDSLALFHLTTSKLGEALGFEIDKNEPNKVYKFSSETRREIMLKGYSPLIKRWINLVRNEFNQREFQRLEQLAELAAIYDRKRSLAIDDFVNFIKYQKVESPETSRVRVMTIHKSKGLEFDIVVLPELDTGIINNLSSKFITDNKSIPRKIYRKSDSIYQEINSEIKQLCELSELQQIDESLSVLYVAMTRTKYALYMLTALDEKSEKVILNPATIIKQALRIEKTEDKTLYSNGNKFWQPKKEKLALHSAPIAKKDIVSIMIGERLPSLERITPSELEGQSKLSIRRKLDHSSLNAIRHGNILHRLFQKIEWIDNEKPQRGELERELYLYGLKFEEIVVIVDEFYKIIEDMSIYALFCKKSYIDETFNRARVYREHSFAVKEEQRIIVGSIDRLVLLYNGSELSKIEIIDFKTDRVSSGLEDLKGRSEYYKPQIRAYMKAARNQFKCSDAVKISAKLAFVMHNNTIEVSEDGE